VAEEEDFQEAAAEAAAAERAADGEIMKDFLTTEQEQEVVEAIRAAEARTSGEIRVVITSRWILRPERCARRLFDQLGMERTRHRNGALIVLFARRRRFVVLGDDALEEIIRPQGWQEISAEMSALLREGRKVEALIGVIRRLGATMAAHWPPDASNPDELPNAVVRD
jgi:uncharacterized membrane protein